MEAMLVIVEVNYGSGMFPTLVTSYHGRNVTSEIANFKRALPDADCNTIGLKWTKDLDRIYFWGFGEEHLLCKWPKGQNLRMQRRAGRMAARAPLGT